MFHTNFSDGKGSGKCIPQTKIDFLKTVNCAGTSVQNIILRYALKHDLNIVLPEKDTTKQGGPNVQYTINDWYADQAQPRFEQHIIQNTAWEKANLTYHMFLLHTRWNHREISQVMNRQGKEKVFYFSVLRDPLMLFRSYWDFFGLSQQYGKTLDEYAKTVLNQHKVYKNMTWTLPGYNQMLNDFEMIFHEMIKGEIEQQDRSGTNEQVAKVLSEIDSSFDLILLADEEFFEDGMVLLMHDL